MIDFGNTEIAFNGKTKNDLKRSYWLFKIISWRWLIKLGSASLNFFIAIKLPITGLVKATIYKQFCGGENIEECKVAIQNLAKLNVKTILDYSVEGKQNELDFDLNVDETLATIKNAHASDLIPFSVFKATGLGRLELLQKVSAKSDLNENEKEEYQRVINRVNKICQAGSDMGVPIFIDAEETWIQNAVDELALKMMRKFNANEAVIFNTAQMYRRDRLTYLKEINQTAISEEFFVGMKLVRGAYIEKERARAKELGYDDPMQKDKAATDRDFNLALKFCMENIDHFSLCCGSHNEESSQYLVELMKEHNLSFDDERVYFAQLLGMSDHISMNLAKNGYNVAKYVPYGPVKEVIPYLIRRAEENRSISGQTTRELALILKEQERRKS